MLAHIRVELSVPLSVLGPIDISDKDLESEFIRLFDVPDGPATPLYTGVYAQRRRDAMEELLRVYRHFGLTIGNASQDLPDFVPTILEFLQFLATGAAQAEDVSREPFLAATADLIERHLGPWVAETSTRLEKRNAHPFYRGLIALVGEVTAAEAAGIRGDD
jgi:DMSO reductase family type II enzyme chaperone